MTAFFRFPHTPHLVWLGEGEPRGDKVLSSQEARDFLMQDVIVEEKVDGANVGFSVDEHGELRVQSRGNYLSAEPSHPQFRPLFQWLESRRDMLADALFPDLMLFGEWCFAVHSVRYSQLPDWFLVFDIYDQGCGQFWSSSRRDALVAELGLHSVPCVARGRFDLAQLKGMLGRSQVGEFLAEGLYVRHDEGDWLVARAKLVRPEFLGAIGEHWSRRTLQKNGLAGSGEKRRVSG